MIDALISGKLYQQAKSNTSKNGNPFVTARVRAAGGDGEALFVNVIAFNERVCDALLALDDGDSVSLSGSLTPKVWTSKDGVNRPALDLLAHGVLTPYQVRKKRLAVAKDETGGGDDLPETPL